MNNQRNINVRKEVTVINDDSNQEDNGVETPIEPPKAQKINKNDQT